MTLRLLNNIPLWAKALAASAVSMLCMVAIGAIAFVSLDEFRRGITQLSATTLPKQKAVAGVTHDTIATHVKVFRYFIWASNGVNPELTTPLNNEILADLELLEYRISSLALLRYFSNGERAKLQVLSSKWRNYQKTVERTLNIVRTDARIATVMLESTDAEFQTVAQELQGLSRLMTERTAAVSEDLARRARTNEYLLAIGGFVGVLLSIIVTLFVARSIVGPIRSITQAMTQVSSGRTDIEINFAERKDEVGQMIRAIGAFRQNIADQSRLLRTREQELSVQNLRFDTALNNMSGGLCFFDGDQRLIVCNRRYVEMYGLDPARVVPGMTFRAIVEWRYAAGTSPAMSREQYLVWRDNIAVSEEPSDSIVELTDGRVFEIHHRPMADGGWVATHEDITHRQKLNEKLEDNLKLLSERTSMLQVIIDNFPGGIGYYDKDLRVAVCNDKLKVLLDLPEQLFANGPPRYEDILRFNAERGEYGPGPVDAHVAKRLAIVAARAPHRNERTRSDGTVLDIRGAPIEDGGFITTYMDITERYLAEAKIAHMARHDALTGLSNRILLNERMEDALSRGETVAVHLLDLDQFKAVNDTLGHPIGDKLLQLVAERLRTLTRDTDSIARMGGDEFAIIQAKIAGRAEAASLARRAIEAIREPYDIDGCQVMIGTSIGIAIAPSDGLSPAELLKNADLALYTAKTGGRSMLSFLEPDMNARMQARHALETDLQKALGAGEFELYFQPMVNPNTNAVNGFEALIRWHHPENGLVSPAAFMPLAEETGLIIPIGEWTIRQACASAAKWPAHMQVAVNLSPAQFRSAGMRQVVVSALSSSGLLPERLELEINKSALWRT